jgi:hypothetical protein
MITKLCSNRYMIRLEYYDNDGLAADISLRTLIDTYCEAGPLKTFLATKTAFWGDPFTRPSLNAGNPMNDSHFSHRIFSWYAPTLYPVETQYYTENYVGSLDNNMLGVFGATGSIAVIEIRYEVDG